MQYLTNFVSKSTIKPELAQIFVHMRDGKKYAVATDSWRLAEIEITEGFLFENLPCGYYTPVLWKSISKHAGRRKMDVTGIMQVFEQVKAVQKYYESYTYPEYARVIPSELHPFKALKVNTEYFSDFLNAIGKAHIDFNSDISTDKDGKMYVYKDETRTLLLMAVSK